jgi:hypothetical protein
MVRDVELNKAINPPLSDEEKEEKENDSEDDEDYWSDLPFIAFNERNKDLVFANSDWSFEALPNNPNKVFDVLKIFYLLGFRGFSSDVNFTLSQDFYLKKIAKDCFSGKNFEALFIRLRESYNLIFGKNSRICVDTDNQAESRELVDFSSNNLISFFILFSFVLVIPRRKILF